MSLVFSLLFGLALLTLGGEVLVNGASRLAQRFGLSALTIGLTVVAFGTSAPELAVSVKAAFSGEADIALGNVVGSNIFNVLFILGLCAIILPLRVTPQLIVFDVPVMIACSCLALFLSLDGKISSGEGLLLVILLALYNWVILKKGKSGAASEEVNAPLKSGSVWVELGSIAAGVVVLVLGADFLVDAAVELARLLGLSELVIALTIIAGGTSLPEVAASVVATYRGKRDIAIGNVVGSNIFNILSVLGISSAISGSGISISPAALSFDIPVMIAVALVSLPIFFSDLLVSRREGALLFFYYICYVAVIIMDSSGHSNAPIVSSLMLVFVLPLTLGALALHSYRSYVKSQEMLRPSGL